MFRYKSKGTQRTRRPDPIPANPKELLGNFDLQLLMYCFPDALKAEGVIPRSPTPVPLEDRPVETLSAEELQELVRRQKVCRVFT